MAQPSQQQISTALLGHSKSAFELLDEECSPEKLLRFGIKNLDLLFRGGLRPSLIEFYGEAGSGKTQLMLHLLLQVQLPSNEGGLDGEALYLNTEGDFPSSRFQQMIEGFRRKHPERGGDPGSHVQIQNVKSVDALMGVVNRLPHIVKDNKKIKLVIIDSIASLFRVDFIADQHVDAIERARLFFELATILKSVAQAAKIPVIVTNQVTDTMSDRAGFTPAPGAMAGPQSKPALGLAWSTCVATRVMVSRSQRVFSHQPYEQCDPSVGDKRPLDEGQDSAAKRQRIDQQGRAAVPDPGMDVARSLTIVLSSYLPCGSKAPFVVLRSGIDAAPSS